MEGLKGPAKVQPTAQLEIEGETFQLLGVGPVPEAELPAAVAALQDIVFGKKLACANVSSDGSLPQVARCKIDDKDAGDENEADVTSLWLRTGQVTYRPDLTNIVLTTRRGPRRLHSSSLVANQLLSYAKAVRALYSDQKISSARAIFAVLQGTPSAITGNTLALGGQEFALSHLSVATLASRSGNSARAALAEILDSAKDIACFDGLCLFDGQDLTEKMLGTGWATLPIADLERGHIGPPGTFERYIAALKTAADFDAGIFADPP